MMHDFCKSTERDSMRLVVAQDLKEAGIDLDSQPKQAKHQPTNKANVSTAVHEVVLDLFTRRTPSACIHDSFWIHDFEE